MDPIISVIIPIYKVEQYLSKCVESVLNQTYKYLEIILVDDGSPDKCGVMCDEYANNDSRIKVIHKENGGLSDARNAGLKLARGDYIGFVDSDDWVEPEMYETMMNYIIKYEADLAICCVSKERADKIEVQNIGRDFIYSRQKALYELIRDIDVQSFAWNKLYRRTLFREIEFPKGRLFEDTLTTYRVFEKIRRAVHINKSFYHYLRREDSILGSWPLSIEIAFCLAKQERLISMSVKNLELLPLLQNNYMITFYEIKRRFLLCNKSERKENAKLLKPIFRFVKNNLHNFTSSMQMKFLKRQSINLFVSHPYLYGLVYPIVKK